MKKRNKIKIKKITTRRKEIKTMTKIIKNKN